MSVVSRPLCQQWQPQSKIRRDSSRRVFRQQLGGRSPVGFLLKANIGKSLFAVVTDNKAGVLLLDGSGWREGPHRG
jgi:hypothetical protein